MSATSAFRLAGDVIPTNRAVVATLGAANAAVEATSAAIPATEMIECFTDKDTPWEVGLSQSAYNASDQIPRVLDVAPREDESLRSSLNDGR
jgi:hypothetical protein